MKQPKKAKNSIPRAGPLISLRPSRMRPVKKVWIGEQKYQVEMNDHGPA